MNNIDNIIKELDNTIKHIDSIFNDVLSNNTPNINNNKKINNIISSTEKLAFYFNKRNIQDNLLKLCNIIYFISYIEEQDIKSLSIKELKIYRNSVEYIWNKIYNIIDEILDKHLNYLDDIIKIEQKQEEKQNKKQEEDLSKLSKEELIKRLKEIINK